MGKIEEAIKKINTEIQKTPNNQYIALVGEHIIDQITTEVAAEQVLAAEKKLSGALKEITAKAKKQAVGNVAAIADSVVYSWAREYFGLVEPVQKEKPQTLAESPKKGISLNLADFL